MQEIPLASSYAAPKPHEEPVQLPAEEAVGKDGQAAPEAADAKPFFTPPAYTIKDIHDAIPAHCFERSTLRSFSYVLRDFAQVAVLLALTTQIPRLPSYYLRAAAWIAYSFCQGLLFTGMWELAHESGHGALSKYKWANDVIGWTIHSALLVPYHSWRFTHSTHHKNTNNIEKDIAFVPDVSSKPAMELCSPYDSTLP
jgi:omega-6 fatty acid desaturase (delta-12 desaturase)